MGTQPRNGRVKISTYGPSFGLLLAWATIDAAVATYLSVYGANVASTLLLLFGVVTFGLACTSRAIQVADVWVPTLVLIAAHLMLAAVVPYRAEGSPPSDIYRAIPLVALGALVAVAAAQIGLKRGPSAWMLALWVIIGCGIVYRIAIVATDIAPPFDVPRIQTAAGQALLSATDPYLTSVYDSGYPYLPISAVAAAIGETIGDARWMSVLGDVLTVAGILIFANRAGAARHLGLAMAALWAWWAGGFYVAWQDFPEPILIGLTVVAAAALVGPRPRSVMGGLLLGLSAATKQFGLGLLPFLPWRSNSGRRALLVATVTWLVSVIPFALWHTPEFLEGTFLSHLTEPGRAYALNLLNWPGFSLDLPLILVFPLAIVFGWLCQRRQRLPVAAWLAGSGGLLLLAFVLNRIAFVNYYAIPLALILLLILALDGSARAVHFASSTTDSSSRAEGAAEG